MSGAGPTPRRPYLLRAMREWMVDNGLTPLIAVDATLDGVVVPASAVRDGRIVLNISDSAVTALRLGNDAVEFRARFSGSVHDVHVPVAALIGVYARESGHGLLFADDDAAPGGSAPVDPRDPDGGPRPGRPKLKVVK